MRRLEIHPEAYLEVEEARAWYESHGPTLGEDFLNAIEQAVSAIERAPEAWPIHSERVRRFLVHRFPFAILYRHEEAKIQIIAVAHQRRRPGYWKNRQFD